MLHFAKIDEGSVSSCRDLPRLWNSRRSFPILVIFWFCRGEHDFCPRNLFSKSRLGRARILYSHFFVDLFYSKWRSLGQWRGRNGLSLKSSCPWHLPFLNILWKGLKCLSKNHLNYGLRYHLSYLNHCLNLYCDLVHQSQCQLQSHWTHLQCTNNLLWFQRLPFLCSLGFIYSIIKHL